MGGLIDIAARVLSQSERRVEAAGQNVANIATPGYKKVVSFDSYLTNGSQVNGVPVTAPLGTDYSDGHMVVSNNPHDLAISGRGFFVVNSEDGVLYTRQGQFRRDGDGRLANTQGLRLAAVGFGDLKLESDQFEVMSDGVVMEGGRLVGRIAVAEIEDTSQLRRVGNSAFAAPDEAVKAMDHPIIRQGMLEASNVSTADEMVAIMEALRRAESGQRLVSVYDDLMGRVITAMGQ